MGISLVGLICISVVNIGIDHFFHVYVYLCENLFMFFIPILIWVVGVF